MKRIVIFCAVLFIFLGVSCSKSRNPNMPVNSNDTSTITATYTQVILILPSSTPTILITLTMTRTYTQTHIYTQTQTPSYPVTDTPTIIISSSESFTPTCTVTRTHTHTHTSTNTETKTHTAVMTSTAIATPVYTDLVSVPGGTFNQWEHVLLNFDHTVSACKIGKYEVTYELWNFVYQWAVANGYVFTHAGREGSYGSVGQAPSSMKYMPVTEVSWRDVIVWCNAYSEKSGLTPVYYKDATFNTLLKNSSTIAYYQSYTDTTPGSSDMPFVNWGADGYRLPTEGEWHLAATYIDGTSWTPNDYLSGATANYLDEVVTNLYGWYSENSGSVAHYVGLKASNWLGIFDMSGNVHEFCWDWSDNYPTTAQNNFKGANITTYGRIARGGSIGKSPIGLQVYSRESYKTWLVSVALGFRVARTY